MVLLNICFYEGLMREICYVNYDLNWYELILKF